MLYIFIACMVLFMIIMAYTALRWILVDRDDPKSLLILLFCTALLGVVISRIGIYLYNVQVMW